jgi:hypothetical protein
VERLTWEEMGQSPQLAFERRFLPRVWEQIGHQQLLLTVDEFEELEQRVQSGSLPVALFSYLRHLMQHTDKLAFIFVGTHRIEDLTSDYWSVLFNITRYRRIGFLNREAAIGLITEPVQAAGMVYDDLAIEEILRVTAGHPYFLQLVCDALVNLCNVTSRNYVTIQDVRDVLDEIIDLGRAHLTYIWRSSTQEEKLSLAVLAALYPSGERVTAGAIADRLGAYQVPLEPGQVIRAMDTLAARDIVQEMSAEPIFYNFTAHLFGHWLRKYKPLSKVVEEVTSKAGQGIVERNSVTSTETVEEGID